MRIGSDHGIVTDGIANNEWDGVEELSSEFDITGGRVCGEKSGSGDYIWFGNFIEQFASVSDVGGFTVEVD